jgi:phosphate transport system substrate-binding protein
MANSTSSPTLPERHSARSPDPARRGVDFGLVTTDSPGDWAWPVAETSFVLMYKAPRDPVGSKAALDFFRGR